MKGEPKTFNGWFTNANFVENSKQKTSNWPKKTQKVTHFIISFKPAYVHYQPWNPLQSSFLHEPGEKIFERQDQVTHIGHIMSK